MTTKDIEPVRAFTIPSLFYDAMSGEFRPKQNERKSTQTLGRLCLYTIQEGVFSTDNYDGEPVPIYTFSPRWAPDVTCQVDGRVPSSDDGSLPTMYGVFLRSADKRELYITNPEPSVLEIITSYEAEDYEYRLKLGRGITAARAATTTAVREFFNNTTYPINTPKQ